MVSRTKRSKVEADALAAIVTTQAEEAAQYVEKKKGRAHRMTDRKLTVADYMNQVITLSEKDQKVIAEECGYANPNVITLIKQGKIKVPINKVELLAKSLGVDSKYLMRLCLEEYMPDAWSAIHQIFGTGPTICDEEMEVIGVLRSAQEGFMPSMDSAANRKALATFAQRMVLKDWAANAELTDKMNKLPSNKRGK